jgi:hypothetical protein
MSTNIQELALKVHHALLRNDHTATVDDVAEIATLIREQATGVISDIDVLSVLRTLRNDTYGIGLLEQVIADDSVTDILVNGTGDIWFDRGNGLELSSVRFEDTSQIRQLATRLLTTAGRRLDDATSYADGHILRPNGSSLRVHAILSPPAQDGTCLSLRVLRHIDATVDSLAARGTFSKATAHCLKQLVDNRRSFVVVGGTGSGKTTLLAALLGQVSCQERIITIEDTAELKPKHQHVVGLVAKTANTEGKGQITMSDLLKQALRMRPDRIVVGEIRGAEVIDLLAALNTGHEGCAGTVHANSLQEVPARFEALAALGGMKQDALTSQLAAAAPVVLAMKRTASGQRILHQMGILKNNPIEVHILWDIASGVEPDIDWGEDHR